MGNSEWVAFLVAVIAALVIALAAAAPPSPGRRWVWAGGVSALVLALLYLARGVLPVFIVGLFLAYLLDPVIDRLQARGWRRAGAIALVFSSFFIIFAVAIFLLVPPVVGQLQSFVRNILSYQEKAESLINSLVARAQRVGGDFPDTGLPQYVQDALARLGNALVRIIGNAVQAITAWLLGSIAFALSFILLPIVTYYFLRDFDPVKAKVKAAIPPSQRDKTVATVRAVEAMVGRFLRGMVTVCLGVGAVSSVILWLLGLIFHSQYALLVGMFAGLTYAIPFVGAWSTVLLGTSVAFFTAQHHAPYSALATFVALVGINQVFDSLVAPSVVGKSIGLHPLWVIFTLLLFGKLFGLPGMLFAWPVAGVIQIIVTQYFRLAEEQTQVEVAVENQPTT